MPRWLGAGLFAATCLCGATTALALSTTSAGVRDAVPILAGGPPEDPDAPIATARYGDAPAHPAPTLPPTSPPSLVALAASDVDANANDPSPADLSLAAASAPAAGLTPASQGLGPSPAPVRLAAQSPPRVEAAPAAVRRAAWVDPPRRKMFDANALLARVAPTARDVAKGRWFLFAASSGKAFGLNIIRDPLNGWRQAGWSQERIAQTNQGQMGVAWRHGDAQLALGASRRKLQVMNFSRDDTVLGITWSTRRARP